MPRITYRQLSHRKWIKIVHQDKCDEPVSVFRGKCQGVKGHSGDHWCYSECGSLQLYPNKDEEPNPEWGYSNIPPGNKDYISPEEKRSHYYLGFSTSCDVKDKQLITKLENDEFLGEDVSIDRMVTEEDMEKPLGKDGQTLREILEERN